MRRCNGREPSGGAVSRTTPGGLGRGLFLAGLLFLLVVPAGCFNSMEIDLGISRGVKPLTEKTIRRAEKSTNNKILMVSLDGVLTDRKRSGGLLSAKRPTPVSALKEKLEKARTDPNIRAVLLRVNSPGGSVSASDMIHRELASFREETGLPLVTMMMDQAASGGYYVSAPSDYILAHPTTLTGSIGVISMFPDLSGASDKFGVDVDVIASGDMKDAGNPFKKMTERERSYFQNLIDRMHDRFVNVVAAGRPSLSEQDVRALADGRVYTAGEARKNGLVDEVGYLEDAVSAALQKADVPAAKVVTYHRPGTYVSTMYSKPVPQGGAGMGENLSRFLSAPIRIDSPRFLYLWTGARLSGTGR